MEKKELAEAIKAEFIKLFPNSGTYVSKGCLGDAYAVTILLGNKSTHSHGIEHNDPLRSIFWIDTDSKTGEFVVTSDGVSLSGIKPSSPYLYCDRVKVPFRRKVGDETKVIKAMAKHFEAVRVCVDDNKANLLPEIQKVYAEY